MSVNTGKVYNNDRLIIINGASLKERLWKPGREIEIYYPPLSVDRFIHNANFNICLQIKSSENEPNIFCYTYFCICFAFHRVNNSSIAHDSSSLSIAYNQPFQWINASGFSINSKMFHEYINSLYETYIYIYIYYYS